MSSIKPDLLFRQKKDEEWYKEVMESIVPFDNIIHSDFHKLMAVYGVINNDTTYFNSQINAINNPIPDFFNVPFEDVLDDIPIMYNKIYPKFMYHVGQVARTINKYDVIPLNETATEFKKEEFDNVVSEFVALQMKDIQESIKLEQSGASPEEIADQIPEREQPSYDNFTSKVEIFYSNLVELFHCKFPIKDYYYLTAKHLFCADRVFVGVVDNGNMPEPKIYNPIRFGFQKSADLLGCEKGSYWYYNEPVTLDVAFEEIANYGTAADLETLKNYGSGGTNRPNEGWDITSGKATYQKDYSFIKAALNTQGGIHSKHIGQSMGNPQNNNYGSEDVIWRRHLEFKAFVKVYTMTSINEWNKEIVEFIPISFNIPEEAQKVKVTNKYGLKVTRHEWVDDFGNPVYIEEKYLPRRFECVAYGEDIYIKMREVPLQPLSLDDFELSVKGRLFTNVNTNSISLVERGMPTLMQIIVVKKLMNRELSKYKGVLQNVDASQIPDYLAKDDNGENLFEGVDKLAIVDYFERVLGKSFSDSTYSQSGMPNYTRSKASEFQVSQAFGEIINMQQFLDLLDRELGMQMLTPPQAEGILQPYSTAGDNEKARQSGYLMAQEYYDKHSMIWKSVIKEWVSQFRTYYLNYFDEHPDQTEVNLSYVVPKEGKKVLSIIPEYLSFDDIGFYLKDNSQNEEYRNLMMNYGLQALAQNRGEGAEMLSIIMKSIVRNESPEEVHKLIVVATKDQQVRMDKMQKAERDASIRAQQEISKREESKLNNVIDKAHVDGGYKLEVEAMKQTGQADADGVRDELEDLEKIVKIKAEQRKLDQGDRKLNIEETKAKNVSKK